MCGWTGKRLRVDLTERKVAIEEMDFKYQQKWLGGRGFNAELIFSEVGNEISPLDPANRLCFGVGPLTGTLMPASSPASVAYKSPLTHPHSLCQNTMGGHWGPELKFAGFDQLVISGCADKPVFLWIQDEKAEIRDARRFWGKSVPETDEMVKKDVGYDEAVVACIGPAGENKVRFASIMSNIYHSTGSGGAGAVMGSKNLKAIAVKGSAGVQISKTPAFIKLCTEIRRRMESDAVLKDLSTYGTMALGLPAVEQGWARWKNFHRGARENAYALTGDAFIAEGWLDSLNACFSCPNACRIFGGSVSGRVKTGTAGGLAYEALLGLGPALGLTDTGRIIENVKLAYELGLDCVSTGGVLSWVLACAEQGLLRQEDTGGLPLEWGRADVLQRLINAIGKREGFGELLAEGSFLASEYLRTGRELTCTVKGVEIPPADLLVLGGCYGLGVAVAGPGAAGIPVLAGYQLAQAAYPEGIALPVDGSNNGDIQSRTPVVLKYLEDMWAVSDSLTQCKLVSSYAFSVRPEDMANFMQAATGVELTAKDLLATGERIVNLERSYWNRNLAGKEEDNVPGWLRDNQKSDSFPLEQLLSSYYKQRGWDAESGYVKEERLIDLELGGVIPEIEPAREQYLRQVRKAFPG